jgi:Ca2+-binding RTX toxin-like protein
MRIMLIVSMVAMLAVGAVIAAAPSPDTETIAAPVGCTETGTDRADVLAGTNRKDVLCGLAGTDYIAGKGKADTIRGGPDNDTLVGNKGKDILKGQGGNDRIFASADGAGGDRIYGGPGTDHCYGDPADIFTGCEFRVGGEEQTVAAMSESFAGSTTLGEAYQDCYAADPSCGPPP